MNDAAMSKEEFASAYIGATPWAKSLREEAQFILRQAVEEADLKVHSVYSRIKDQESAYKKFSRKEYESFEQITDLVGTRVVTLFIDDVKRVCDACRAHFDIVAEDNKIESADDSFGYMSVHMLARMKGEYSGPRYDLLKGRVFEIQIRTILMDAWANVSHHLEYKSDVEIPKELRKGFNALSGLFYVADSQFQKFYGDVLVVREKADRQMSRGNPNEIEINFDTVNAYLRKKFRERIVVAGKSLSVFVRELSEAGYKTIGQFEAHIDAGLPAFLAYEKDHHSGLTPYRYANLAAARLSIAMVNDDYFRLKYKNNPQMEKFRQLGKKS